jgi:hypothetical protein
MSQPKPLAVERNIAVYTRDGALVQWIDEKRAQRLIASGSVARVVRRRRPERIMRITLHQRPGEARPSLLSDYIGTKYSFQQHLGDGHKCYRLRSLGDNPREERDLAPEEVRPIFMRVVTDCLATVPA